MSPLNITASRAVWIDRDTVVYPTDWTHERRYELRHDPAGTIALVDGAVGGGRSIPLTPVGGLTDAQRDRFPHLWAYAAFRLADGVDVAAALCEQVVFVGHDRRGVVDASGVQTAGVLDDVYRRAAAERLGPVVDPAGRCSVAVWAPTAHTVELELFDRPNASAALVPMRRDDATGVWRAAGDWAGRFYRFRVTAWQPAVGAVVTASVTDPYSVALAADSTHSQFVDLDDPALAPPGWATLAKPPVPARAQIQELSVRDFSVADHTVPPARRGTYLAFTETASAGMTHLAGLARAGLTHVHLLPVYDFATAPDRRADRAVPAGDLAALPPDSAQQQARVVAVADRSGYNWGYDPWHYNVPEGSYATDPDGPARTLELRRAVAALNAAGLRVVVDVVYNHTMAAGVERFSVLDQIVPGYYHRLLDDGTVATSTCCANTAPEHLMMGKLVVDSVVFWARRYKVDGFRFDLMGHHPKANLLAVRDAVGPDVLLYGEGWEFGEVAGDARFVQATQRRMAGTGIATFSDRQRDAVRGGGAFDDNPRVQGFGSGLYVEPNGDPVNGSPDDQRGRLLWQHDLIQLGLAGNLATFRFTSSSGVVVSGAQVPYHGSPAGYAAAPSEVVTYVDAHDNELLYDALAFKLAASVSPADRARMQTVCLATVVLGQGNGLVAAGSERLRSKSLDRNSYNSGDWFNAIQWDDAAGNGFGRGLPPAPDNLDKWGYARPLLADPALVARGAEISLSAARYAELLRVRASSPLFALPTAAEVQRRLAFPLAGPDATPGVITMTLDGRGLADHSLAVVFNATPHPVTQEVPGCAGAALHRVLARSADPVVRQASVDPSSGALVVPGRTVAVFTVG